MRILTICPTKGRPDICRRMLDSFWLTANEETSSIIFVVDSNDDCLNDYKKVLKDENMIIVNNLSVTQCINKVWEIMQGFELFHITNDDVIYRTRNWDKMFIDKFEQYGQGIYYGNDLFQGGNLPTFPVVSRETTRAVGYLQVPCVKRYYGDSAWQLLGRQCDCIYYIDNIIIEHMHVLAGKSETNDKVDDCALKHDREAFADWIMKDATREGLNIRGLLNGE